MSTTKTFTLTVEEKFILETLEADRSVELSLDTIMADLRDLLDADERNMQISRELCCTCLGQLIERGLVLRIEPEPGKFCYRRA